MKTHYDHGLWIAAAANATDPNGFGGLPYHLVQAGRSSGLIKGGMAFNPDRMRARLSKIIWNSFQFTRTGGYGGYQYSESFLKQLWASATCPEPKAPFLNLFQLYPESELQHTAKRYFYLDQTLLDVFDYYEAGRSMSKEFRDNVLARERAQYNQVEAVVFRSEWAASRAKAKYGLPGSKVSVVLPGANLSTFALDEFDLDSGPQGQFRSAALRIIFIGKEWRRKGLDRLLEAMLITKADGVDIHLTVIGVGKDKLPARLASGLTIKWLGFFDKQRDPLGFARLVAQHDLGVLLSRNEAGGVSLREFGRLGLPVFAPNTGGSPEFAMSETAQLFAPQDDAEQIAGALIKLHRDRRWLQELKVEAWERRKEYDWRVAIEKLAQVL